MSSIDEQQQNTSVSTQEVLYQHTKMLEHQTEVIEELGTGMSALHKLYSQCLM